MYKLAMITMYINWWMPESVVYATGGCATVEYTTIGYTTIGYAMVVFAIVCSAKHRQLNRMYLTGCTTTKT